MKDPIERQDAIDALKEHRALFCDNTPDTFAKLPYGEKCRVDELDVAIATLINLPSAQPEIIRCKDCKFSWMTNDGDVKYCDIWFPDEACYIDGDHFCASAERREE